MSAGKKGKMDKIPEKEDAETKKIRKDRTAKFALILFLLIAVSLIAFIKNPSITGYITYNRDEISNISISFEKQMIPFGTKIDVAVDGLHYEKDISVLLGQPYEIGYDNATVFGWDAEVKTTLAEFIPSAEGSSVGMGQHTIEAALVYGGLMIGNTKIDFAVAPAQDEGIQNSSGVDYTAINEDDAIGEGSINNNSIADDDAADGNMMSDLGYTIQNTAPVLASAILNSTGITNGSTQNLTANAFNATDADNDALTLIYDWRVNDAGMDVLNMPFDSNISALTAGAVRDYSKSGNNGTLGDGSGINAPNWTTNCGFAGAGGCYLFDDDDTLIIANHSSLQLQNLSIELWVNISSAGTYTSLFSFIGASDGEGYGLLIDNSTNDGKLVFMMGNSGFQLIPSTNAFPLGTPHQIMMTFNGITIRFYIDGTIDTTVTGPEMFSLAYDIGNMKGVIGKFAAGYNGFVGTIDNVKIYNRSLSPEQISLIYNQGSPKYNITASQELKVGENWTVEATPNDNTSDGSGALSNGIIITDDTAPTLSALNCSPTPINITMHMTCNMTAADNSAVDTANATITLPNGTAVGYSSGSLANNTEGRYWFGYNGSQLKGRYNVTWWANDTANNKATGESNFTLNDPYRPDVFNITPSALSYSIPQIITITANVTDNGTVEAVLANITIPGQGSDLFSLSDTDFDEVYNATYNLSDHLGIFNITIIANDTAGNINSTGTSWFNASGWMDGDGDGIYDGVDSFAGNTSNVTSAGVANLTLFVNATTNITQIFNSIQKIEFKDGDTTLISIPSFNFSQKKINLSEVVINITSSGIVLEGINLTGSETKSIFVNASNFTRICIKNANVTSLLNVSIGCNETGEILFMVSECTSAGTWRNGTLCAFDGNMYNISNLTHTGIRIGGNTTLTIFDENDPEGGSFGRMTSDFVKFYANYTPMGNASVLRDATCVIFVNGMTDVMGNGTAYFHYNSTFNMPGTYAWNVTCNSSKYETLNISDTITIQSPSSLGIGSVGSSGGGAGCAPALADKWSAWSQCEDMIQARRNACGRMESRQCGMIGQQREKIAELISSTEPEKTAAAEDKQTALQADEIKAPDKTDKTALSLEPVTGMGAYMPNKEYWFGTVVLIFGCLLFIAVPYKVLSRRNKDPAAASKADSLKTMEEFLDRWDANNLSMENKPANKQASAPKPEETAKGPKVL